MLLILFIIFVHLLICIYHQIEIYRNLPCNVIVSKAWGWSTAKNKYNSILYLTRYIVPQKVQQYDIISNGHNTVESHRTDCKSIPNPTTNYLRFSATLKIVMVYSLGSSSSSSSVRSTQCCV